MNSRVLVRILIVLSIALIALSVLGDPYTHHLNGSDGIMDAPVWQLVLARTDVFLLLAAGSLIILRLDRAALLTLGVEFVYALMVNAILIGRDGFERFIWGFGAERHWVDFVVMFALRVLIVVASFRSIPQPHDRAA